MQCYFGQDIGGGHLWTSGVMLSQNCRHLALRTAVSPDRDDKGARRISGIGLRPGRPHTSFDAGALANRAIARPSQGRKAAVTVGTAGVVAVANGNTSTARRSWQWTNFIFRLTPSGHRTCDV